MKLYDFPGAPNPRRVKIFAAEKNIELELYDDVNKSSVKSVWVICYLPITDFNCNKPLNLNNNFIMKKDKNFNLIKLVYYEKS